VKHFGICVAGILFLLVCAANFVGQPPSKKEPQKNATSAQVEAAQRGKAVFERQCAACHYPSSTAKKIGPGLKDVTKRKTAGANGKALDDASLRAVIEKGGKNMPGFKALLSNQQVSDLVAYLKTL
jgi:mono/diheme cytochrome c family protein